MKLVVLDTLAGDEQSEIFVYDESGRRLSNFRLGYVPELEYDASHNELVTAETVIQKRLGRRCARFVLRGYDANTWKLRWEQETPRRPMYTGYPGRSRRVSVSPCSRYVYCLASTMVFRSLQDPGADDVFRLQVLRYDRETRTIETGRGSLESCMVAFGVAGAGGAFYFHLSCDYPSTVAFGNFETEDLDWVRMDEIPAREHGERETVGSWFDATSETLYCVNGRGDLFGARRPPAASDALGRLPLEDGESVALQQIHGAGDWLFIGVSADHLERSLSLSSRMHCISRGEPAGQRHLELPFPVLNFVAAGAGAVIAGVSPYARAVCLIDAATGRVVRSIEGVGKTPAEVLVLP